MVVFCFYRETAIGRSNNSVLATCSLLTNLLLHVTMCILFTKEQTPAICVTRSALLYSFLVLQTTMILIKIQIPLKAFGSSLRATRSEINKNKTLIVVYVLLLALFNLALQGVVFKMKGVPFIVERDNQNFKLNIWCDTSANVNVSIPYLIMLYILCFIQAYRGRNLPGVYLEAMNVVWQSFVSIVEFGIMIPIFSFQKHGSDVVATEWLFISIHTFTTISILHGKTVYVLLFRKDINNIEYVRTKTFSMMKKHVSKQ